MEYAHPLHGILVPVCFICSLMITRHRQQQATMSVHIKQYVNSADNDLTYSHCLLVL